MPSLDHIFICTPINADVPAARLAALGLTEGTPNTHHGQGTACRRFFFHNAYLELLWVADPAQARSPLTRPTHLWDRWSSSPDRASPFGLCFRPGPGTDPKPPFESWEYRPSYLPDPLCIHISTSAPILQEPMLFHLTFVSRPDAAPAPKRQSLDHPMGLKEITRVTLIGPHPTPPSPQLSTIIQSGRVTLQEGPAHLIDIGFDGEAMRCSADLRPDLAVILRW